MGAGGGSRLGDAAAAFTSNARNPDLRRAQLSFLGAWTAEWAFTVALGIVAYRDGGATALGLVGLLRMVPAAICAPLLSPIADRGRRERVLVLVSTVRGVATAAAAVVAAVSGPAAVVYALAVLSTIAATLFRPAHSALLPSLCRTGYELASANMVRGTAGLRGHPGRPAAGCRAAPAHQRRRRLRRRGGCLAVGGGPAAPAAVRRPAPPGRPEPPGPAREAVEGVRAVARNRGRRPDPRAWRRRSR